MKSLKSAYNLLLGAAVAVVLSGCADGTAPDGGMQASLTVTREVQNPADILPFTPTVTVGAGEIGILGQIHTPTPCYRLSTELSSADNVITLTVRAESSLGAGGVCAQVLVVRDYRAAIRNVAMGRYIVRVVHSFPELSRAPDIVLEQQVDVP